MTTATVDINNLTDKTVFLRVKFGFLGNTRKVKGDILETDADKDLLKVNKTLLDSKELEAIRKADGKLRTYLYNICLPYDIGCMLLPTALVSQVDEKLKEFKDDRDILVEAFIVAYPSLCESAAKRLGTLFNPTEYKNIEQLRNKFSFGWQYISFGVPGQLKGISADIFEEQKKRAEESLQQAGHEITLLMRQSLLELVQHLKDRLEPGDNGKTKIIRESAVGNIKDFLNNFDFRNIVDDKDLQVQVDKVRAMLTGVDADKLRNSDLFRESLHQQMSNVSDTLSGMVEDKAIRKFKFVE